MFKCCMRHLAAALILMTASLCGCSGFQSPKVSVNDPVVTERSDDAVVLTFDMGMQNPNAEPLELREMFYTLRVDGTPVYVGRRDAQHTLPADGGSTVNVPAVIPYSELGWSAGSMPADVRYELNGSLRYVAPGQIREILMESGIHRPTVGFRSAGTVAVGSSLSTVGQNGSADRR